MIFVRQVLKCIMLREGYLERLKRLVEAFKRQIKRGQGQVQVLPPGMVDLLELLRLVTLDTVEAISFWRLSQVRGANAFAPPITAKVQDVSQQALPVEQQGTYIARCNLTSIEGLHNTETLAKKKPYETMLLYSPWRTILLVPKS